MGFNEEAGRLMRVPPDAADGVGAAEVRRAMAAARDRIAESTEANLGERRFNAAAFRFFGC